MTLPSTEVRARAYHAFDLVREDGSFASFDPRDAARASAWLRHAAHATAGRLRMDEDFVSTYVCGHGEGATEKGHRLSYVPVPSVGHPHVDGRIRRVLLVEPFGASDARSRAVVRGLANETLVDERGQHRSYLRYVPDPRAESGVFQSYLQQAVTWGSVTPVILPGLDDRRSRKAVGLVSKSLAQAGYTTPVEGITVQSEPVFAGADLSRRYFVPEHLRRWPCVHVIIKFSQEVPGPVSLGAGRHYGLGAFASLSAPEASSAARSSGQ